MSQEDPAEAVRHDPELFYYDPLVTWTESWPGFVGHPFEASAPTPIPSAPNPIIEHQFSIDRMDMDSIKSDPDIIDGDT